MNTEEPESRAYAETLAKVIRWSAWLALVLMGVWLTEKVLLGNRHEFPWLVTLTVIYTSVYAIWMVLPWKNRSKRLWKLGWTGFIALSFVFVFLMIANIMVDASAAGARGERLGVPGLEGALLFLSLAQIPGLLFERHPEMMN